MKLDYDYDVAVTGSSFSNAVRPCHLVQAGYSEPVLERGRQRSVKAYPYQPAEARIDFSAEELSKGR